MKKIKNWYEHLSEITRLKIEVGFIFLILIGIIALGFVWSWWPFIILVCLALFMSAGESIDD